MASTTHREAGARPLGRGETRPALDRESDCKYDDHNGTGGWLRTGDLGELDADGYLTVTGRKKDLIITATGKNVAPSALENALRLRPYVSQAVVIGDRRPHLAVLVTLDPDTVTAWAAEQNIPGPWPELARRPEVKALVQAELVYDRRGLHRRPRAVQAPIDVPNQQYEYTLS